MRILITADLHSRRDWFDWLLRQQADLTVVAGDLLDGFRADGLQVQMRSQIFAAHFALSPVGEGGRELISPGKQKRPVGARRALFIVTQIRRLDRIRFITDTSGHDICQLRFWSCPHRNPEDRIPVRVRGLKGGYTCFSPQSRSEWVTCSHRQNSEWLPSQRI